MGRFDALASRRESDLRDRMSRYRAVAANRLPAKLRVAASIPAGIALDRTAQELWRALEIGTEEFLCSRESVRRSGAPRREIARPSLLDLVAGFARLGLRFEALSVERRGVRL